MNNFNFVVYVLNFSRRFFFLTFCLCDLMRYVFFLECLCTNGLPFLFV